MTDYNTLRPVIENNKLVLISEGGSRSFIGIREARKQLKELDSKTNLRGASIERRELLRQAVDLWDAQ